MWNGRRTVSPQEQNTKARKAKETSIPLVCFLCNFFEKYAAVYGAFVLRSLLFLKFLVFF